MSAAPMTEVLFGAFSIDIISSEALAAKEHNHAAR
jgi:hypothetical protein